MNIFTPRDKNGKLSILRIFSKNIREYFMGKSGGFHGFFRMLANLEL